MSVFGGNRDQNCHTFSILLGTEQSLRCFNSSFVPFFFFDAGHALDEKDEGNPVGDELLSLTQSLKKMTGLANNLTAEYKEKFDLLF